MPLIWQRQGTLAIQDAMRPVFYDTLGIALFVNDYVPVAGSVLADFTEATFPGYVPQSISTPNPAIINGGGEAEVDADIVTFTASGASAQVAYGFFCYNLALTVICALRFPAPQPMGVAGSSLDVGAKFTALSQFN